MSIIDYGIAVSIPGLKKESVIEKFDFYHRRGLNHWMVWDLKMIDVKYLSRVLNERKRGRETSPRTPLN